LLSENPEYEATVNLIKITDLSHKQDLESKFLSHQQDLESKFLEEPIDSFSQTQRAPFEDTSSRGGLLKTRPDRIGSAFQQRYFVLSEVK
jgi:hypothetical protein